MTSALLLSLLILLCGVHIRQISADTNRENDNEAGVYEASGGRIRRADNYYQPALRKPQYEELIEQYEPASRTTAAQTYSPSVADSSDYSGQSYSQPASYRPRSQSQRQTYGVSNDKSKLDEEAAAAAAAKEEEEKKPDRLALLLQDSKFSCSDKKDGYYADESVSCQVFHYCVSGAKHSWQCPENTVFHQIHLNCVPAAQDICKQSSKFHVVNDYLYKQLEQRGPNNTIRYHQRYYPEGYSLGDPLLAPAGLSQGGPYNAYESDSYDEPRDDPRDSRAQSYKPSSYQSYPAAQPARPQSSRPIYKPQAVSRPSVQAYNPPSYSTQSQAAVTPTRRPTYATYSTPNAYPTSDYSSSDSDYPSSGSSYASGRDSDYSPAAYSSPAQSTSYPPGSSYSGGASYQPSLSNANYPAAAPSLSASGVSNYSPYKPAQTKPVAYANRQIGIPIASFRVAASPNYGSTPQASRIRTAAYSSPSSFSSLGDFISGVKYDEDY